MSIKEKSVYKLDMMSFVLSSVVPELVANGSGVGRRIDSLSKEMN